MMTLPLVGSSSPAIMFNVVVLPHPDGPTKIMNSPSLMSRLIPATAVTVGPNCFTRFSSLICVTLPPALSRGIYPKMLHAKCSLVYVCRANVVKCFFASLDW